MKHNEFPNFRKFLVIRASPETKEQLAMVRELHDNQHLHEVGILKLFEKSHDNFRSTFG